MNVDAGAARTALTTEQRAVVEAPDDAHITVLAVAGSGKTTTMVHRLAELVSRGVAPTHMRAVMFNKAAQRSLAQSLARQLGPEGIHVAHVVIDAVVDMPASRAMLPDRPDAFFAQPADIADSLYFLTQQPRSAWTFELDLRAHSDLAWWNHASNPDLK